MIHVIIKTGRDNYPPILIVKHVNVLAEVIKCHDLHLLNITP